jgi:[protein-PII] uridylyltransferase
MTIGAKRHSDALVALAERAAWVDGRVMEAAGGLPESGIAILAAGGYGRRQLFPHSDIDLLLLCESDKLAAEHKSCIATFLQRLWDGGMRVSQQVRTPGECLEVDHGNTELTISLLDQRFLGGDRALYGGLCRQFPRFIERNREALMRNLARVTHERHAKYAGTFYHLEPNVKETPGGLRDCQVAHWMEQLRATRGVRLASPEPGEELLRAFRFLARLRWYLHEAAGRDNNILTFEAQDAVAADDPAEWMREYYRHARAIYRAAQRALEDGEAQGSGLFAQFVDWRSRLSNADFGVHRERVHFRAPQQLDADPLPALRLFEFVARHGMAVSREAATQLELRMGSLREYFREPRPIWPALGAILALPHAPLAVRWMHETGVLFALFGELERIECLVVRDFYHRYTVDEHTLVALQSVGTETGPGRFGELWREVENPALLRFALLFHDAGKGSSHAGDAGGRNHVEASVRLADAAMRRIQMPATERETVRFLIRNHLELSAAMRSRDLEDPEAIRDLADRVETVERLKALTLVTYADISAVNPTAMTPWRAQQLWRLYVKVHQELTRGLETERISNRVPGPKEWSELLEGLPMRYLRTRSEDEIAGHVALEEHCRARGAAVEVRRLDSVWQLTAIARDRVGLFAAAAGTLAGFGMNILRAEAFSNRRGVVLDTFVFADPHRTLELNPTEVDRLRATAERVLLGKIDVRKLLRNRPKPRTFSRKGRISAAITFDGAASSAATMIEIVAEDRPGLLYDLASAISSQGGNIEVVLTDTQAHKAIDVFYVTFGGGKASAEQEARLGEALRGACG